MRKLVPLLALTVACTTTPSPSTAPAAPPASASTEPSEPGGAYGLTVQEEARILALEDRREYDAAAVQRFVAHENPLHRIRIALALGRIGAHSFIDQEGDGRLDQHEMRAGVAELLQLARDPDPRVRAAAAFALGETGDPASVTTLTYMWADPDGTVAAEAVEAVTKLDDRTKREIRLRYLWKIAKEVPEGIRARAIRYLFRFNDAEISRAAIEPLGDPSPQIRQEAAYTLSRNPDPSARPQLELLINDPNPLTRAYVTTALGRIGAVESMPLLINALGDIHPWVRTNAAVAISRVAERHKGAMHADHLPRLFAALEDPDPGVRANSIETLGHYAVVNETARAKLIEMMENGSQWNRDLAVIAFFQHLEEHTARDLAGTNRRPAQQHDIYRAAYVKHLSPWGLARTIEAAKAWTFISDYAKHEDPQVRAAMISTMNLEAAEARRGDLRKVIESDPDVIVRAAAIEQYGKTTKETAALWMATLQAAEARERKELLNDARLAAIRAIAEFEGDGREDFLLGFLGDADPVVRRVAAELFRDKEKGDLPAYAPLPINRSAAEYEAIVRWAREPHTATVHMPRGKIEVALLTQDAPMTAWNFAQLAQKKYFDNTSFMRVVPNFVIQGGDPRNDMNGGPGYAIRDEINQQRYTRGAVGMALSGPDTGGSQFFITHSPQPHLDGGYTIFGRVYDGMSSVVDQVERGDRVTTITIDEHPPVGEAEIGSVPNVSLPLQVGPIAAADLVGKIPGYAESSEAYYPDAGVMEMFPAYLKPEDRIEVYMGTWCHDSQREVPKLLSIQRELEAKGATLPASFFALDRTKQRPAALIEGKSVTKVATFIYYRGDRELGRIEERQAGLFEDDLLAIAARE